MTSTHSTSQSASGFDRFGLDDKLLRALRDAEFTVPRPIQDSTVPAAMTGQDIMGLAQTGTGKTAAFALPILQRLIEEPGAGPLVLVLAPTRELALQIDAEFRMLAKYTKIKTVTIFGGKSAHGQIQALRRRPEIVVGCPGRVLDLLQQGKLILKNVETLVLDEADHMFDMGFLPDIRRILSNLPQDRQTMLFSATMPHQIRELASRTLHSPHVAELAHTAPPERIAHFLCPTSPGRKRALLDRILAEEDCKTAIVFTRTKHRAKRLARQLEQQGLRAVGLQGNMSQNARDRAMGGFREGKFDILVATDIAARGLDVAGIDYVINFDPPSTPEIYCHRIGRTGRSEASGIAVTLVTYEDVQWVRDTERLLRAPIEERRYSGFEVVDRSDRKPADADKSRRSPNQRSGQRSGPRSRRSGPATHGSRPQPGSRPQQGSSNGKPGRGRPSGGPGTQKPSGDRSRSRRRR